MSIFLKLVDIIEFLKATGLPKLGSEVKTSTADDSTLEVNIKPTDNKIWILNTAMPYQNDVGARLLIIKINDAEQTLGTIYRANLTNSVFTDNLYKLVPAPFPFVLTSTHFLNFACYAVDDTKTFTVYWSYFEVDPSRVGL